MRRIGHTEGERISPEGPMHITLYTTSWCPSCRMAKHYLSSKGLTFTEVDIERTPGAAEIVMAEARGFRTVPTFIIEDEGRRYVVVDMDRRKLDDALQKVQEAKK
jgi:mycoredoxin